jgi:hypothetical protein
MTWDGNLNDVDTIQRNGMAQRNAMNMPMTQMGMSTGDIFRDSSKRRARRSVPPAIIRAP